MKMARSSSSILVFIVLVSFSCWLVQETGAECLADPALDAIFVQSKGGDAIPQEGSCCQNDVCNIPCPLPVEPPGPGYGVAVGIIVGISFSLGIAGYFMIKGDASNYFVAGHSLNLPMVAIVRIRVLPREVNLIFPSSHRSHTCVIVLYVFLSRRWLPPQ